MRFTYTAEKPGGEVYQRVTAAQDRFELYKLVRQEGGHLLTLHEDESQRLFSFSYWNAKFTSVPEQEKILFARNLGSMISAGLPLSRALSVLERQTKNVKLRNTIAEIEGSVRHGDTLHGSLAQHPHVFPKLMVAMVRAGEEGSDLSSSLTIVAEQMEKSADLKKKVRSALMYPCIILFAIVAIGSLMMTQVVPTLASTFKDMKVELPSSTKAIIAMSDFLVNYTSLALTLFVTIVGGIFLALRSKKGSEYFDAVIIHLPLIGPLVKEINSARTARTLASLFSAGIDVLTSIDICSDVVQNSQFQKVLKEASADIAHGKTLSSTFIRYEHLFPAFVGEMTAVGEETGQISEMLKRVALFYESEVDRKTKDMSTIIEPFLMLFIGAGVGFFAVSMITPIYSISQNI